MKKIADFLECIVLVQGELMVSSFTIWSDGIFIYNTLNEASDVKRQGLVFGLQISETQAEVHQFLHMMAIWLL